MNCAIYKLTLLLFRVWNKRGEEEEDVKLCLGNDFKIVQKKVTNYKQKENSFERKDLMKTSLQLGRCNIVGSMKKHKKTL